jgi:hypothetical protein
MHKLITLDIINCLHRSVMNTWCDVHHKMDKYTRAYVSTTHTYPHGCTCQLAAWRVIELRFFCRILWHSTTSTCAVICRAARLLCFPVAWIQNIFKTSTLNSKRLTSNRQFGHHRGRTWWSVQVSALTCHAGGRTHSPRHQALCTAFLLCSPNP